MAQTMIPHSAIRSALRKLWLFSPTRREAFKLARIARGVYQCRDCTKGFPAKGVECDHIEPVGKTPGSKGATTDWNGFMLRLFCSVEGLAVKCSKCHAGKTYHHLP